MQKQQEKDIKNSTKKKRSNNLSVASLTLAKIGRHESNQYDCDIIDPFFLSKLKSPDMVALVVCPICDNNLVGVTRPRKV